MARYTGPIYKKSRRLGFSVLENGKNLQKDLMLLEFMELVERKNLVNMEFS